MNEQGHSEDLELAGVEAETVTGGVQPPITGPSHAIKELLEPLEPVNGAPVKNTTGARPIGPERPVVRITL